jgi:hypothetical protein
MAGEISSLKGKSMSRDLTEIDQREYIVIKNEETELKTLREIEWKTVHRPYIRNCLMFLVASVVGGIASGFFGSGFLFAASLFTGIASLVGLILSGGSSVAQNNKIQDIEDNRLGRLRNKVEVLDTKIPTANEVKEELRSARDFFKTKYDLYLGLRHRPITNVSQHTHVHTTYKKA